MPYNKGVWSGDYWSSHYTTFPTGEFENNVIDQSIRGDDHVLWKYEFIGDSKEITTNDSNPIKPLSVDYFHLTNDDDGKLPQETVSDGTGPLTRTLGPRNSNGDIRIGVQTYPNFLNEDEINKKDIRNGY